MAENQEGNAAVPIGPKVVAGNFDKLYREGMALIEEVAAYLDGEGRQQARDLPRDAALLYATESMRLTTRLMQLASWLLLQRAVKEGEITPEKAREEKSRVKFMPTPEMRGGPGWQELPELLVDYIAKGDRLFERVMQFDSLERGTVSEPAPGGAGGVADQLARLKAAYGHKDD